MGRSHGAIDENDELSAHTTFGNIPILYHFWCSRGPTAATATLLGLPGRDIAEWHNSLMDPTSHKAAVQSYLLNRADTHDSIRSMDMVHKSSIAERYNKGIKRQVHKPGDLVMLHQKKTGKLEARWRGPFRISGCGGIHATTFILQQLDGTRIRGTFHGDDLKQFKPRSGYLWDESSPSSYLPMRQTIRNRKSAKQSPIGSWKPP